MPTNDYQSAKDRCWVEWLHDTGARYLDSEQIALIKNAFDRAYQLGTAHAQSTSQSANLRLHLAAMAMQGLLSNPHGFQFDDQDVSKSPENVAEAALMYADALLAQLNQPTP